MAIDRLTPELERLAETALKVRKNAYCPYSNFAVGAALLDETGKIWTGVNVENAAYGPTNCAERTAFFKAVSEGEHRFQAIAIAGGKMGEMPSDFCAPCGVCRQVMREFCGDDFKIILVKEKDRRMYTLSALLPESFSPKNLQEEQV